MGHRIPLSRTRVASGVWPLVHYTDRSSAPRSTALRRSTNQTSGPGSPSRTAMTRSAAKRPTIGPLLPSLIVCRHQRSDWQRRGQRRHRLGPRLPLRPRGYASVCGPVPTKQVPPPPAVAARPACRGAPRQRTTAHFPPHDPGRRDPAHRPHHRSPNDSARSPPDAPPGSSPTPRPAWS